MKVAVFGATGKLGRRAARAALEKGYVVRALVRDRKKIGEAQSMEVFDGDLADHEAIGAVIEGVDGVLWCVGASMNRFDQPPVFRSALQRAISAIEANGKGRIVVISGAAITYPGDSRRRLPHRLMIALVRTMAPQIMGVNDVQRDVLLSCDVDWVAVRPMTLSDAPGTGRVIANASELSGGKISREDVAGFMVEQLEDDSWLGRAPLVSV